MPPLSAFLPAGFDPQRPLALIAGQGLYPVLVTSAARQAGVPLRLIAFDEETPPELIASFPESDRRTLLVGQLGKMLKALKEFDAGYALMAGQITPRRLFKGLHPDLKATKILLSLKRRNAETIFGAIAAEITDLGVTLLDARSFLDAHLATPGVMSARSAEIFTRTNRVYLDGVWPGFPEVVQEVIRNAQLVERSAQSPWHVHIDSSERIYERQP